VQRVSLAKMLKRSQLFLSVVNDILNCFSVFLIPNKIADLTARIAHWPVIRNCVDLLCGNKISVISFGVFEDCLEPFCVG